MKGMIVKMRNGTATISIWPDGRTVTDAVVNIPNFESQLLAVRRLRLVGWQLTDPNRWEEAEV
jgi:hypothetical protein